MRINRGRGWEEMGPGRAQLSTARAASVSGVPIGQMTPEWSAKGAVPLRAPADFRSANPLGMKRLPDR